MLPVSYRDTVLRPSRPLRSYPSGLRVLRSPQRPTPQRRSSRSSPTQTGTTTATRSSAPRRSTRTATGDGWNADPGRLDGRTRVDRRIPDLPNSYGPEIPLSTVQSSVIDAELIFRGSQIQDGLTVALPRPSPFGIHRRRRPAPSRPARPSPLMPLSDDAPEKSRRPR